jgi:hypothetical protein
VSDPRELWNVIGFVSIGVAVVGWVLLAFLATEHPSGKGIGISPGWLAVVVVACIALGSGGCVAGCAADSYYKNKQENRR